MNKNDYNSEYQINDIEKNLYKRIKKQQKQKFVSIFF